MQRHLAECFQRNKGKRGVTFYDEESCNFLDWLEVFHFIRSLPKNDDHFVEKLTETLANYDPNKEFLAVHQKGTTISVEVFSFSKG